MFTLELMMDQMKITGAKYLSVAVVVGLSFYIFWKRTKNQLDGSMMDKTLQYDFFSKEENYKPYNSFIEFFDSKNTEEAYNKYKKYIDLGMNQENAFKSVIENKFNND